MNYLSQYIVPFSGLENKEHVFSFVVEDEFFTFFDDKLIKGAKLDVDLHLVKKAHSLHLKIRLNGYVKLICDRCLEVYNQQINFTDTVNVEFGEETDFDTNSDIVILDKKKSEINISQFIYEFTNFALPLQHYHPQDENGNDTCDVKMIEILNNHLVKEEEKIDPRWEALKELKN